ncbi:MAG TPA: hypothetical protein VJ801_03855, partial [Polyangia bacterium]|nr:hypothetical protein [Polyangia bacterium]
MTWLRNLWQRLDVRSMGLGIAFVLLALVHLFRNGQGLALKELSLDEAGTWGIAVQSFWRNCTLPTEFHSQPPLYYFFLHFAVKFGESELYMRGISWLFCLAVVGFAIFGLREIGPLSRILLSVFFVLNGLTNWISRNVRPYAMAALAGFLSLVFFVRLLENSSRRRAIAYVVATTVMLYVTPLAVWTFASQLLFALVLVGVHVTRHGLRATFERYRVVAAAMLATGLLYVPYFLMAIHYQLRPGPGLSPALQAALNQKTLLGVFEGFSLLGVPFSLAVLGLILLAVVAELAGRRPTVLLWLVVAVGQVAFAYGFLLGRTAVYYHYMTPAYPAFCFLVALGFHHLTQGASRHAFKVASVVLVLLALRFSGEFRASVAAPMPDQGWRRVRTALAAIPGQKVVFFDTGYYGQFLEYYARKDRDLVMATMKGTGWASGGENHLAPSYVQGVIREHGTKPVCYFYRVTEGPLSQYRASFVPAVTALGYTERPALEG